jgi:hypothetical protein
MAEAAVVFSRGAEAAAGQGIVGSSGIGGSPPSSGGNAPSRSSALGITLMGWTFRCVWVMGKSDGKVVGRGGSSWPLVLTGSLFDGETIAFQ